MIEFLPAGITPEIIHFPAGEPHIVLTDPGALAGNQYAVLRGSDADELITLTMWAHAVHADGGHPHALIPYLPGARADRAPRLEAKVYADLINSAEFTTVTCIDPHSTVITELIARLNIVTAADLIADLAPRSLLDHVVGIIAPDEGAHARAHQVAERLGVPTYQAHKHRDFATGQLTGFSCDPLPETGQLLVVDDICDGGGTFMGLASAIADAKHRIHLWISHGIFSGHSSELPNHFASVMTTDSFPGCRNIQATVYPATPLMLDHHLTRSHR